MKERTPTPWNAFAFLTFYRATAGVILTVTGIAKIWSANGKAGLLDVNDPVLGIKFGQLMLVVGLVELTIALICFFWQRRAFAHILLAWFSTNVLLYRFSLWSIGWKKSCSCLGNLTDALHIRPETADTVMIIILAYLLIGSYATLFWLWRQNRKAEGRMQNVEVKPELGVGR